MNWTKQGVIFAPDHNFDWMVSHASVPVVDEARAGVLRIYFGTRDQAGRSQTSYIEVDAQQPEKVLYIHDKPILSLGSPGSFDDNGIMPSWVVNYQNKKFLYYIGWNLSVSVPYHLSIGLASSIDGGQSFLKASQAPLLDRSFDEPFFNTAPCVLYEGKHWYMWYVSCTGWEPAGDRLEPRYNVKFAESSNPYYWSKPDRVCIGYDERTGAVGRPCVYKDGDLFKMIYSYRGVRDYRTDPAQSYRLGYAESTDGFVWRRHDDQVGIERSESGWDSEMMEYCCVYQHEDRTYLFYNGNGFGKTGIGYAILDSRS